MCSIFRSVPLLLDVDGSRFSGQFRINGSDWRRNIGTRSHLSRDICEFWRFRRLKVIKIVCWITAQVTFVFVYRKVFFCPFFKQLAAVQMQSVMFWLNIHSQSLKTLFLLNDFDLCRCSRWTTFSTAVSTLLLRRCGRLSACSPTSTSSIRPSQEKCYWGVTFGDWGRDQVLSCLLVCFDQFYLSIGEYLWIWVLSARPILENF